MSAVKFSIFSKGRDPNAGALGFTLVEFLVTVCIAGFILTVIYSIFYGVVSSTSDQMIALDLHQSMRACISIIEKEVRMAGYDPTGSSGAGVIHAGSDSLVFSRDLNGDGDLILNGSENDQDEVIRYELNSSGCLGRATQDRYDSLGNLLKAGRRESMSMDIHVVMFSYLDSRGNPLSPLPLSRVMLGRVAAVQVTLGGETRHPLRREIKTGEKRSLLGDRLIFPEKNDRLGREVLGRLVVLRNR